MLTFEWDLPQGSGPEAIVDNYIISILPSPLSSPGTNVFFVPLNTAWNVTLNHNEQYSINLTALNCAGDSDPFLYYIDYGKIAIIIARSKILKCLYFIFTYS